MWLQRPGAKPGTLPGRCQDEKRRNHRVPQLGRVVVEDDVVVGAACCLDRAAFGETRIGAGTVLDNLCHIAHNVKIGEDCILTDVRVEALPVSQDPQHPPEGLGRAPE